MKKIGGNIIYFLLNLQGKIILVACSIVLLVLLATNWLISVGIHVGDVERVVTAIRNRIFITLLLGMAIGIASAMLLARRVKKTLSGLEPAGIARLLEERNAMLQSIKEGILAVDQSGKITLANEAAISILSMGGTIGHPIGQEIDSYIPNTGLTRILKTGLPEIDQAQELNGIYIITNRVPIRVNGKIVGAIATFRDKAEINRLAEKLTGVRCYEEALRSQAHEFMNKLHVILGMAHLEMYDQLKKYIKHIADEKDAEISFISMRIKNPVIAGLVLSKLSKSREMKVSMTVDEDALMLSDPGPSMIHEIVTILGNLIDNALEAVQSATEKKVVLAIHNSDNLITIQVRDSGPGLRQDLKDEISENEFSDKVKKRWFGLYLVQSSVKRLKGSIDFKTSCEGTEAIVVIPVKKGGNRL